MINIPSCILASNCSSRARVFSVSANISKVLEEKYALDLWVDWIFHKKFQNKPGTSCLFRGSHAVMPKPEDGFP